VNSGVRHQHAVTSHVRLNPAVFDVWVFRRAQGDVEYLLLRTSELEANRYFGGGRFWQVPSDAFRDAEAVPDALDRKLAAYGLRADALWAAEYAYTIYNRRFDEVQIITVYAAEVPRGEPRLDPAEHSAYEWLTYEAALAAVHYRGLKEGLRSVREYVTGPAVPPRSSACARAARILERGAGEAGANGTASERRAAAPLGATGKAAQALGTSLHQLLHSTEA